MSGEAETKDALRRWLAETNGGIMADEITDNTLILEQRILTSLHVMELVLYLEDLTGQAIDVQKLDLCSFDSVNAIYRTFFTGGSHGHSGNEGHLEPDPAAVSGHRPLPKTH